MKRLALPSIALAVSVVVIWSFFTPVLPEAQGESASFDLVGAKKCKMCHNKEASGAQFTKWTESRHAGAYETLAGEKALEIAKARDIADPQKAPECLKCHVTAFPVMATIADQKITLEEGVSCESCHGAGSGYWKKTVMEAVRAGEQDAAEVGLIMPTAEVCTGCHNEESPTFKKFDFEASKAKIAHPYPEGM